MSNYDSTFPPITKPIEIKQDTKKTPAPTKEAKKTESVAAPVIQQELAEPQTIRDLANPNYQERYKVLVAQGNYKEIAGYFGALIRVIAGYYAEIVFKDGIIDKKDRESLKAERQAGADNYGNAIKLIDCIKTAARMTCANLHKQIKRFHLEQRLMQERWEGKKGSSNFYGQGVTWRQKEIQDLLKLRKGYLNLTASQEFTKEGDKPLFESPAIKTMTEFLQQIAILKEEIYTFKDAATLDDKEEAIQYYFSFKKMEENLTAKLAEVELSKKTRSNDLDQLIKPLELGTNKEQLAFVQTEKNALEAYWTQAKYRLDREIAPTLAELKATFKIDTQPTSSTCFTLSASLQELTSLMQKTVSLKEVVKIDNGWEKDLKEQKARHHLGNLSSCKLTELTEEINRFSEKYTSSLKSLEESIPEKQSLIDMLQIGEAAITNEIQKLEKHLETRKAWQISDEPPALNLGASPSSSYFSGWLSFGSSPSSGKKPATT